jgi:hypothetical protein
MDKDKEENKIEESSGVYLYGPDVYVLSNRQNPKSAFVLPQEYGEANQTDTPQKVEETKDKAQSDGPVCPQCGNAIIGDPIFCCECGFKL